MPVKDLVKALSPKAPKEVAELANGLVYRDFITVGLLIKKPKITLPDNWIYIQERDVKIGRLQIFNNWSPYMVKDNENTVWMGLEYFCNEGDEMWNMPEKEFIEFAINELAKIGMIKNEDVLDSTLLKMPKAYPSYFGAYNEFDKIREYLDTFENLYLIGRNGMHRYNNQDHSMLTAIAAVENISKNIKTKDNIWDVNTEKDYHEEKS
jgi:protoporphyrinogen oxidase